VTYTAAAGVGLVAALMIDLALLRTRLVTRCVFWVSFAIVVVGQLVVNGVLTGRHVVRYDPEAVLGPRIVYAPIEDLAFGFALVLTTLSLWMWWQSRSPARRATR
jgi:lycopene cyclase domain-containing protein